jgi:DNA-binding MarR family transcriptional regulator
MISHMTAEKRRDAATPTTWQERVDMSGLNDSIGFLLKQAQLAHSRMLHDAFAEFDITAVQFSALTVASNNPGILQSDLAAALHVERPRIVPVLDALERRGLTERRHDANDRRSRRIHLTDIGETLLTALQHRVQVVEDCLATALGRDRRTHLRAALVCIAELPPPTGNPAPS